MMARIPRGMRLVNPRVEGRALVYDLEIAWWRRVQLMAQACWRVLWRDRPTVRYRR